MNRQLPTKVLLLVALLLSAGPGEAAPAMKSKHRPSGFYSIQKRSSTVKQDANDANDPRMVSERAAYLATKRKELEMLFRTARGDKRSRIGLELARDYLKDAEGLPPEKALPFWKRIAFIGKTVMGDKAATILIPETLYLLGMAHVGMSQDAEAAPHFARLLKLAPDSNFADEADRFLGDQYFESNRYAEAEKHFEAILTRGRKPLARYARFRRAWCAYDQGRFTEAVVELKKVIDGNWGEMLGLREEALADIVLPFADGGMTTEALTFFAAREPKEATRGIERLAGLLLEKGRHGDAIRAWQWLLDSRIEGLKRDELTAKIIQSQYDAGAPPMALSRLKEELAKRAEAPTAAMTTIFEPLTRGLALRSHQDGQKKIQERGAYEVAQQLYTVYLHYFPKTAASPTMRLHLGDILVRRKDFRRAATLYRQASLEEKNPAKAEEELRQALGALESAIDEASKTSREARLVAKDIADEATPFTDDERVFLGVGAEYLRKFPSTKYAVEIELHAGRLLYRRGRWAQVEPWLQRTLPKIDGDRLYAVAAMLVDSLNRQGKNDRLTAACRQFLEDKRFTKPDERKELAVVLRRAQLKSIQAVEGQGAHREAARGYLAFFNANKGSDRALAETALFNASVMFRKSNLLAEAADVELRLLQEFPESPRARDLLLPAARAAEGRGDFEHAAAFFDEFVRVKPSDPNVPTALALAGVYHLVAGHRDRAESALRTIVDKRPSDSQLALGVLLDLLRADANPRAEMAFHEQRMKVRGLPEDVSAFHAARLAELIARTSPARARQLSGLALGLAAKARPGMFVREARAAVGRIRVQDMEAAERSFESIALVLPQKKLEKALKQKIALVTELERRDRELKTTEDPDAALAGWHTLSVAYRHLASAVLNAPIPPGLAPEEEAAYRAMLQAQMVDPFLRKSKELAKRCRESAESSGVLSSWLGRCAVIASELDPKAPRLRLPFVEPDLTSPAPEATRAVAGAERPRANTLPGSFGAESIWAAPIALTYPQAPRPIEDINQLRAMLVQAPGDAKLLNQLAIFWLGQGKTLAAKALWAVLVARGEKDADLRNNLGVACYRLGDDRQAESWFRLAADADHAVARRNLGFLSLKYRNGREAAVHFEAGIAADPRCRVGLAVAKLDSDTQGAIAELKRLQQETPADPYLRLAIGLVGADLEKGKVPDLPTEPVVNE